jgi:uroporphyrinogen decarboxylase
LQRLREFEPETDTPYVLETVRMLASELKVPLLAFAGAPFTVGSYLVEGKPSRDHLLTKKMMTTEPQLWHDLMQRLAQHAVASLRSQLDAGASAYQLFDSWAGNLTRDQYRDAVLPHSAHVISELKRSHPHAPSIHFGVGCDHLLELMHSAGALVIGLDWRTTITDARMRLGKDTIVQGNLDPSLVQSDVATALAGADTVLADNANHPGHIFNLGHGVTPGVNPDVLAAIVQHVHERTKV